MRCCASAGVLRRSPKTCGQERQTVRVSGWPWALHDASLRDTGEQPRQPARVKLEAGYEQPVISSSGPRIPDDRYTEVLHESPSDPCHVILTVAHVS